MGNIRRRCSLLTLGAVVTAFFWLMYLGTFAVLDVEALSLDNSGNVILKRQPLFDGIVVTVVSEEMVTPEGRTCYADKNEKHAYEKSETGVVTYNIVQRSGEPLWAYKCFTPGAVYRATWEWGWLRARTMEAIVE